jgi:prevent-host-death family protein
MGEASVAEAKNHLPRLIHQAEHGEPIHITRHGRPVAVLLAAQEYSRLTQEQTPQQGFLDFLETWRTRMAVEDDQPLSDNEIDSLRDKFLGRDFTWDE